MKAIRSHNMIILTRGELQDAAEALIEDLKQKDIEKVFGHISPLPYFAIIRLCSESLEQYLFEGGFKQ